MPVQKYACPNDTTAYDPGHASARHTLFAGTTVLQAGISSDAAVHAVVTATGGCVAQKNNAGMMASLIPASAHRQQSMVV